MTIPVSSFHSIDLQRSAARVQIVVDLHKLFRREAIFQSITEPDSFRDAAAETVEFPHGVESIQTKFSHVYITQKLKALNVEDLLHDADIRQGIEQFIQPIDEFTRKKDFLRVNTSINGDCEIHNEMHPFKMDFSFEKKQPELLSAKIQIGNQEPTLFAADSMEALKEQIIKLNPKISAIWENTQSSQDLQKLEEDRVWLKEQYALSPLKSEFFERKKASVTLSFDPNNPVELCLTVVINDKMQRFGAKNFTELQEQIEQTAPELSDVLLNDREAYRALVREQTACKLAPLQKENIIDTALAKNQDSPYWDKYLVYEQQGAEFPYVVCSTLYKNEAGYYTFNSMNPLEKKALPAQHGISDAEHHTARKEAIQRGGGALKIHLPSSKTENPLMLFLQAKELCWIQT